MLLCCDIIQDDESLLSIVHTSHFWLGTGVYTSVVTLSDCQMLAEIPSCFLRPIHWPVPFSRHGRLRCPLRPRHFFVHWSNSLLASCFTFQQINLTVSFPHSSSLQISQCPVFSVIQTITFIRSSNFFRPFALPVSL